MSKEMWLRIQRILTVILLLYLFLLSIKLLGHSFKLFNPLKFALDPVIWLIDGLFSFLPHYSVVLMVVSILGTFPGRFTPRTYSDGGTDWRYRTW